MMFAASSAAKSTTLVTLNLWTETETSSISVEAKHPVLVYHDIVSYKDPSKTCHRERELQQLSQRPHVEDQSGLASSPENYIFVSRFSWSDLKGNASSICYLEILHANLFSF